MIIDILEKLFRISEQFPEAPTMPTKEKPYIPHAPAKSPSEPKRRQRPSTPIRPVPHQTPEPKGVELGKDVELFKQRRKSYVQEEKASFLVHPEKAEWIKSGDPELDALFPNLSGEEKGYLELIVSNHYNHLVDKLEQYTGLDAKDLDVPQLVSLMLQSLEKVVSIESKNKEDLEKLALDLVLNLEEFEMVKEAVENGEVRFDIALKTPEIDLLLPKSHEKDLSFEEQMNYSLASEFEGVDPVRLKQRLANLLIQGGAVLKTFSFPLVNKELSKIHPDLSKLYGVLSAVTHLGYFLTPFGIEKAAARTKMVGGAEEVVPEDDKYIIRAEALTFPFLVHEIVKGIYDWISIDPRFTGLKKRGIEKETEDIIVGPEVFRTLQSFVPINKQYLLPLVQKKFLDLDSLEVQEVLSKSEKGISIVRNLVWDSEDEWGGYLKTKREATKESILESKKGDLYHLYVEQKGVPKEVFNQFVEEDPSRERYKYLPWMLKQYILNPERVSHIRDVVRFFDTLVQGKKIHGEESNIFGHDLDFIEDILNRYSIVKTKGEIKREEKTQSEKIAETDKYIILRIDGYPASCFYGANTKWCISGKTQHYWYNYWTKGNIYIVIDKQKNKKYAIVAYPKGKVEVYDELDKLITFDKLQKELGIQI